MSTDNELVSTPEDIVSQRAALTARAVRCGIPYYMIEGLVCYILDHRPTGEFLRRVLENDLSGAVGHADDVNITRLPAYVTFLYTDAPSMCKGSPEKVAAWLGRRS